MPVDYAATDQIMHEITRLKNLKNPSRLKQHFISHQTTQRGVQPFVLPSTNPSDVTEPAFDMQIEDTTPHTLNHMI